jgi:hypothetical protein
MAEKAFDRSIVKRRIVRLTFSGITRAALKPAGAAQTVERNDVIVDVGFFEEEIFKRYGARREVAMIRTGAESGLPVIGRTPSRNRCLQGPITRSVGENFRPTP